MKKTAITGGNVVLKDHLIRNGVVLVEGTKILMAGPRETVPVPEDAEVFDAAHFYVGPGLIDIHTHCGKGIWFSDDPAQAAAWHLVHGTTSVYPALYFSFDTQGYVDAIEKIRASMAAPEGRNIRGFYMEGPYLNPKYGANKENAPWRGACDPGEYLPVIRAAGKDALVWALAPERENIMSFIRDVRTQNPSAVFAVAHSEASPEEVEELIPYGLRIGTHHTDATGAPQKYPDPEIVPVGVDEAVNMNHAIWAELIVDEHGIHVDPYMLRYVRRVKGEDRIILISDSSYDDGPVPEGFRGVTDLYFDHTGEISGSKLTLDMCCRNMMTHTGASVVDVFRYASSNPARACRIRKKGFLRNGYDADIVIVDHEFNVQKVMLDGEFVS